MQSVIIGVIVVVVLIILIWFVSARNGFVALRNRVKDQAAQIDVQLKRRFDLIPNLVAVVKSQAGFEKSTLEAVVQARAGAAQAKNLPDTMKADNELASALGKLFAVAESYPDLKSNAGFNQLSSELADTEDKIAYSRQFYNDTVLKYNNAIQMFPGNIAAGICGFSAQEFLATADNERESVKISADDLKV